MKILDHQQHRSTGGEPFEKAHQHLEQLVLLPLRGHGEGRVLALVSNGQQIGKQRHYFRCV